MIDGVLLQLIIAVASTVTAAAMVGAVGYLRRIDNHTTRNTRLLLGSDNVEEWDGVVQKTEEHREALRREGLL